MDRRSFRQGVQSRCEAICIPFAHYLSQMCIKITGRAPTYGRSDGEDRGSSECKWGIHYFFYGLNTIQSTRVVHTSLCHTWDLGYSWLKLLTTDGISLIQYVLGAFSLLSFFSLFFPFFWFGHLAFTYEDISIAWFNILCNKQLVQACNCEWRQKPTTSMKSESWPLMCLLCQPMFCIIFSSSCLYN